MPSNPSRLHLEAMGWQAPPGDFKDKKPEDLITSAYHLGEMCLGVDVDVEELTPSMQNQFANVASQFIIGSTPYKLVLPIYFWLKALKPHVTIEFHEDRTIIGMRTEDLQEWWAETCFVISQLGELVYSREGQPDWYPIQILHMPRYVNKLDEDWVVLGVIPPPAGMA